MQTWLRRARYVVIVYDYKLASESKTSPATRVAPLRENRSTKCIAATIDARRTTAGHQTLTLCNGDLYYLFDGSRPGNHAKLRAGFVSDAEGAPPLPRRQRLLSLVFNEEGAAQRRQLVRNTTGSIKQQEGLMMVTRTKPKTARQKRLHFEGTSAGDVIMNIPPVTGDEEWRLPVARKRQVYAHYRVDVGGKGDVSTESEEDEAEEPALKALRPHNQKSLSPQHVEPVTPRSPPTSLLTPDPPGRGRRRPEEARERRQEGRRGRGACVLVPAGPEPRRGITSPRASQGCHRLDGRGWDLGPCGLGVQPPLLWPRPHRDPPPGAHGSLDQAGRVSSTYPGHLKSLCSSRATSIRTNLKTGNRKTTSLAPRQK